MIEYDREILVEVLVYHYRKDISSCGCGWAELGKSYPEHVAEVYEKSVKARHVSDFQHIFSFERFSSGVSTAMRMTCSCGVTLTTPPDSPNRSEHLFRQEFHDWHERVKED